MLARSTRLCCGALLLACFGQLTRADIVYSWGSNDYGQLGDGTTTNRNAPVAVTGLPGSVTAISGGSRHSLIVQQGAVYSWGLNDFGQLGDGTTTNRSAPVAVSGLTSGVTAVAGGEDHSLALQNGAVYGWGANTQGLFGDGSTTDHFTPAPIIGLTQGVTLIATGMGHGLAVQNGGAFAWGDNIHDQLGDGTTVSSRTTPVPVIGLTSGVTAIATGAYYSLAIQNGALYAWGDNQRGQLGDGTTVNSNTPEEVTGLTSGVTAIAAGFYSSVVVQNGGVYTWGDNGSGELGDGTTVNRSTPERIDAADLNDIVSVAAGQYSTYALAADGSLWVWGDNSFGELGLGSNAISFLTPQHLLPAAGYRFTAVDADSFGIHVLATLTPVPEPSSLCILFCGATLMMRRRRR